MWTNGCFDVLHRGHLEMLEYAKSLGDYLVVGVDDDERVNNSKGDHRPYNNLKDRMYMLESIGCVDEVVWFGTDSELRTKILLTDAETIVVGSDYKDKEVIGSDLVKKVVFFDRVKGYSTTKILERNDLCI